MVWPFKKNAVQVEVERAAKLAASTTMEQIGKYSSQQEENGGLSLKQLGNCDDLFSGYALGIAVGELHQNKIVTRFLERRLGNILRKEFWKLGKYLPVLKYLDRRSNSFEMGFKVGAQESTNKHCNKRLWEEHGSDFSFLYAVLRTIGHSTDDGFTQVNVQKLIYEYGVSDSPIASFLNDVMNK